MSKESKLVEFKHWKFLHDTAEERMRVLSDEIGFLTDDGVKKGVY